MFPKYNRKEGKSEICHINGFDNSSVNLYIRVYIHERRWLQNLK